jgi:hypothetical protein
VREHAHEVIEFAAGHQNELAARRSQPLDRRAGAAVHPPVRRDCAVAVARESEISASPASCRSGTHADALPLRSTTADVALRGASTAVFGRELPEQKGVRTQWEGVTRRRPRNGKGWYRT